MNNHNILENKSDYLSNQSTFSNASKLRKLVREIGKTLVKAIGAEFNDLQSFNYSNTIDHNPFGYDYKSEEEFKNKKIFYRRNCLYHKLARIQNEFEFVKRNIKKYQGLTHREKEIIKLLVKGKNNPEIANQLYISRHTVEQHRKHINKKLEIKSFSHLMRYAYAFNLI